MLFQWCTTTCTIVIFALFCLSVVECWVHSVFIIIIIMCKRWSGCDFFAHTLGTIFSISPLPLLLYFIPFFSITQGMMSYARTEKCVTPKLEREHVIPNMRQKERENHLIQTPTTPKKSDNISLLKDSPTRQNPPLQQDPQWNTFTISSSVS